MFPSIDNVKGMQAVRDALETRETLKPSTTCIIEALEICLYNNNSVFAVFANQTLVLILTLQFILWIKTF